MKGLLPAKTRTKLRNFKITRNSLLMVLSFCFLFTLFSFFNDQVILLISLGILLQVFGQKALKKTKRNAPAKYSSLLLHEYYTNLRAGRQPHESLMDWKNVDDEEISKAFREIALKIASGYNIELAISEGFSQISDYHPELSYINQIYDSERLLQSEMELLENRMRCIFRTTRSKTQIFIVFASFALFIVPFSTSLVLILFQPNKSFVSAFVLLYPVLAQYMLSLLKPWEASILS